MTPVRSSPRVFSAFLFALLLAPAVMAAEPATAQEAPVLAGVSDVELTPAAAPVMLVASGAEHEAVAADAVAAPNDAARALPQAATIGATVGAAGGFAGAIVATVGLWALVSADERGGEPGPPSAHRLSIREVANVATPTLLVALPGLGAGLGSSVALLALTDTSSATLAGVTTGFATSGGG